MFFGGVSPDVTADLTLTGAAASDWFGYAVGAAGDVNGDGYGDVIVGARYNDAGGTDAGRAYVFYGGASPNTVADLTLTGLAAGESFGRAVGTAGDVDGDGYADVIVGAYLSDAGGADAGRAYVFYGGASTDQTADVIYTGEAAGNYFGYAVGAAGDVNGDGYDDVAVAAYRNGAAGTDAGRAYVYYGGDSPDGTADITLTGAAASDAFGVAVGCVGDVNGDGHPDLAVGATGNDAGGTDAGAAYVYDVGPPPATAFRPALAMTGERDLGYFGLSVGTAGDVNGDSYADVIVGASHENDYDGAAHVYFGGPGADARPDLDMTGNDMLEGLGNSVGTAGDVNGDGYDDVIVGASANDAGGVGAGRAYVYYGGATPNEYEDWTLSGPLAGDCLGGSVGTAGDVNGDGYADVVVGADWNDAGGADAGRAYVFFGGPAPDAVADLTLTGAAAGDYFGISVGTAGDMNGDGYDDVIVGATGNSAAGTDAGRAYVYYGGPGADATADLVLTGAAAEDYFGGSVGTAGDMNGDGYDDVIVGAAANDAGGTDAGRAYVYYGGAGADATADLVLTGAAAGDWLGRSVGTAGDANGDGYADVIVSANGAGNDVGAVYVYYGGPSPDAVADRTLPGPEAGASFGACVATAGDVRGDGFPDVIVGAPYHNDGTGYLTGAAYLYDCNRYLVSDPDGGEIWDIGATESVSWLGAERANVWLSMDGGSSYDLLAGDVGGADANSVSVAAPGVPSSLALVKVTPCESWMSGSDVSDSVFIIRDPAGVGAPGAPGLALRAPWPNPARGVVRLALDLPGAAEVTLSVFDVVGREIARPIATERFAAGTVAREWRPDGLAPGIYTVRARVGEAKLTRRLVWLGGR